MCLVSTSIVCLVMCADVLTKKMVCSLGRYPAQMQTTADVAEVLCYQSTDHIHRENSTTARRAGDMRQRMHQPNRGVHPLPAASSCPSGWRRGRSGGMHAPTGLVCSVLLHVPGTDRGAPGG